MKSLSLQPSALQSIFQSLIERLVQGIPGVFPYFDDVLVSAANRTDLLSCLCMVLHQFQEVGLKLKKDKCQLVAPQVGFLGYLIDTVGLHPTATKVQVIQKAPTPTNKMELQVFLKLLKFYSIFLPYKVSVAEPLHQLLDNAAPWSWGKKQTHSKLSRAC